MLKPDQIEALRGAAETLLDPVVDYLIEDIAKRVAKAGQLTATAQYQIWRAQQLGLSQYEVKKRVAALLKISQEDAKRLFEQAAETGYSYDLNRLPTARAIPFQENTVVQQIVRAAVDMAGAELENLTQSLGFVGQDGRVEELTTAFIKACDFAFMQATTGAVSPTEAVRNAVRGLRNKGIQWIDYESGRSYSVEAAVRRNVYSAAGIMQEKIGQWEHDATGCDGWEISAHTASAPDHEPIQGKQYSDEAYTRLNNSLIRRIGTLNCGHAAFPIILGVSIPANTPEELAKMAEENEKGFEYNGKHYTRYEATQRQRLLERKMREDKRKILIDQKTEDSEALGNDQIQYIIHKNEYKRFSEAAGLRLQPERAEMAGFGPKQARAADRAYKEKLREELRAGTDSGNVPKKEPAEATPQDVTELYKKNANPGNGTITFEEGYKKGSHSSEIITAEWLRDTYGGDIKLIAEKPGKKTPDYEWRGKMWELKAVSSVNSADKNLQKAIKQIAENPGGVVLDAAENEIDFAALEKEISRRIGRHQEFDIDILIRRQGETRKILRYKKIEGR